MTPSRPDQPLRGIAAMLTGATAFSAMSLCAKYLNAHYDVLQTVFFRSLFVLLPATFMILLRDPALWRTRNMAAHFWRGTVGFASMLCMFYSFKLLPLADAVAINFLGPVFAVLFAMILLRERARLRHWLSLGAGLVGVLIMTQPGHAGMNWLGFGVAMLGTVLFGITQTCIRILGRTENALTTVWVFALMATIFAAAFQPLVWRTPAGYDWLLLIGTGLFALVGQIAVTKAYQYAPAATIGPFNYTSLIWAMLFGALFWDEQPTPQILLGAAIIIAAGSLAAIHEARSYLAARVGMTS